MSADDPQAVVQWREAMMWLIKSNADISGATIDSACNSVRYGSCRVAKLDRRPRPLRSTYHRFIFIMLFARRLVPGHCTWQSHCGARARDSVAARFRYNAHHRGQTARAVATLCPLVSTGVFD